MGTAIVCFILVIIAIFSIKSYMKKLSHGCCGGEADVPEKKVRVMDKKKEHYPYHKRMIIEGMTCKNCVRRIENAFNSEEGCYAVASLKEEQAELYMKQPLENEDIIKLVQKAGYQVKKIETV